MPQVDNNNDTFKATEDQIKRRNKFKHDFAIAFDRQDVALSEAMATCIDTNQKVMVMTLVKPNEDGSLNVETEATIV